MDIPRKDMEKLLESLQPSSLSPQLLERLERCATQAPEVDASFASIEKQCQALSPRALSPESLDRLLGVVQNVPFALDEKVVLFPGQGKNARSTPQRVSPLRRYWAAAAVATMGGLAALFSPPITLDTVSAVADPSPSPMLGKPFAGQSNSTSQSGIVATSFGSGIERAEDEGVIWTQDRQPCRVLRFQYQDRVLVRDKNGVDRMLFMPREELYVVPEKCD